MRRRRAKPQSSVHSSSVSDPPEVPASVPVLDAVGVPGPVGKITIGNQSELERLLAIGRAKAKAEPAPVAVDSPPAPEPVLDSPPETAVDSPPPADPMTRRRWSGMSQEARARYVQSLGVSEEEFYSWLEEMPEK